MSDAVTAALRLQLIAYIQFSGLAILAVDYCATFTTEILWTWNRPWSFVRALFLLVRYVPFILVPITIFETLGPVSMAECSILAEVNLWLSNIVIVAAECILIIRTWVLWGKKRTVLIGLIALGLAYFTADVVLITTLFGSITYTPLPSPPSNCVQPFSSPTHYIWGFFFLVAFELVIFVLTIYRIPRYKHHQRIFLMVRNDLVYLSCILGMSVINTMATKEGYVAVAYEWQVVLHSVLASRLFFSMRQMMQHQHVIASGSVAQPRLSRVVEMLPMTFEVGTGGLGVEYNEC
ncbi:hypothetical protein BJ138DRAFT_393835 [Hygrophoropsis aurantiaca]|uniref:Uncharacterized protein n=1 Tax=Hygrophoropsis aurantiaca TaxID=72124 RepID=A0ACB8A518_9AGAM|nr:hypothetical protein BJ138DRAFT_393835 [Hygrophoropsis aurantiaca]